MRFHPGHVVATPGALAALQEAGESPILYLRRHLQSDWGKLCNEDWEENNRSLKKGYRLLSAYTLSTGERLWIITEADRSATTILLPDEY